MQRKPWVTAKASQVLQLLSGEDLFSFNELPDFPVVIEDDFEKAVARVSQVDGIWSVTMDAKVTDVFRHMFSLQGYDAHSVEAADLYAEHECVFKRRFQTSKYYSECYDSIVGELYHCYLSRLFNMNDEFWEQIFQIYNVGCWPCGWEGAFPPLGKFVVFTEKPNQSPSGACPRDRNASS